MLRVVLLCTALLASINLQAAAKPVNVLMIIVDDLAPVVSAYGGPVATPAIDQLAARGVRFTNNFANVPVCGASRASFLSGLAPTANRFLSFDSRLDEDVEGAVSLPAFFRNNGWHTVANGKVFDVIADSAESWAEPVWSPSDAWHGKPPDGRGEHLQSAYIEEVSGRRRPFFERLDVADTDYPDGQVAAKSVDDLQRLALGDAPFFLAVGFRKPHLPFNAPERYWTGNQPSEVLLPETWHQGASNMPAEALHRSPELRSQYDALPLFGDPSDVRAAEIINAYHAAVRYADAQVGVVLEGLADSGAADNTLVVLLGDHGFLLGQQRLWTKHALFEPALRTPLIIHAPGAQGGGHEARAVTDLLDVFPTLVALAGLEVPEHLDGVSLQPLLENSSLRERPDKAASISRWMGGESVRHANYRYTRFFEDSGDTVDHMLFDLEADPYEQINLATKQEFAEVVAASAEILNSQRVGPVWSDALDEQYSLWRLASSSLGGVLLAAVVHPVIALLALLLVIAALVLLVLRLRRP